MHQGLLVPILVPTKQAETSERVTNTDGIVKLATQSKCALQNGVRRIEVAQKRVQIALSQVDLSELRAVVVRTQQREHLVDELLLPVPHSKGFA